MALKGRLQTQGPNWPPTFPNCFLSNVIRKSVHFIISLVVFMIIGATITFGKKNDEKTRRTCWDLQWSQQTQRVSLTDFVESFKRFVFHHTLDIVEFDPSIRVCMIILNLLLIQIMNDPFCHNAIWYVIINRRASYAPTVVVWSTLHEKHGRYTLPVDWKSMVPS